MRADFVANASHELRTPLASLKGYVETLQGKAKDDADARARFLKIMEEQAERMSRLVDDLLSLSRVEMREHLPPSDEVDLGLILREVAQALEPVATRAGITLDLSAGDGEMVVRGDADELTQVFQNLIHNAIKYGHTGGKVEIVLRREPATSGRPPGLRVDVVDDGPGIPPRAPAAAHRALLSRERGGKPREGRHRARPCHRQAHPQSPPRRAGHQLEARPGLDVLGAAAVPDRVRRARGASRHVRPPALGIGPMPSATIRQLISRLKED